MSGALRPLRQVLAFARKEIADIVRQPKLVATLVLGPFLVLAAFAVGYRDTPDPMRTVFVGPEGSPLLEQVERYAEGLDEFVDFQGVSHDHDATMTRLKRGEIDLMVTFPDDPAAEVLAGRPATLTITHTRLDPIERSAIVFASQLAVGNINGEVLARIVAVGQTVGQGATDAATSGASTLIDEGGDELSTARRTELASILGQAEQVEGFLELDPRLVVSPFESAVEIAVPELGRITDWYVPAAVVLIVQQFGVAFGALSFVREDRLGIVEIFRAGPVGALASLLGKYLAYLAVGGLVGAALCALVILGLGVPVVGGIGSIAVVIGLTLFASIGLGVVVSLASRTDAQAVQYTMIVLLASLFFSGFFLSVEQMRVPARIGGFLLPVTYAMELLRDVMLRGAAPEATMVLGLAAYGLAMFLVALFAGRRRLAARS